MLLEKKAIETKLKKEEKSATDWKNELEKVTQSLSMLKVSMRDKGLAFCDMCTTINAQMESDTSKKDRGSVQSELQTARETLVKEKHKKSQIEQDLQACQNSCRNKDLEISSMRAQAEALASLKKDNQQLVQQAQKTNDHCDSLTQQVSEKEKARNDSVFVALQVVVTQWV